MSQPNGLMPLIESLAPSRVVIFRALQLGDMLCAVPALRALRKVLPRAHIALVGLPWAADFVRRYAQYVDEFIAFPGHPDFPEQVVQPHLLAEFYSGMRARRFDLAIQLHGSGPQSNFITRAFGARFLIGHGSPARVPNERFTPYPEQGAEPQRLLALLAAYGVPSAHTELEFPVTEADRLELARSGLISEVGQAPYICIHPGARLRDKCWHPARFAQVADRIAAEFGVRIVLTGSANEADLTAAVTSYMRAPVIDAASALSVGAMAAIFERSRLLVANDTGVSHIAAGLRLPSVIIFTKADMERWAPMDRHLHRCLWDPEGERVEEVAGHARTLLLANLGGMKIASQL